MARDQPIFEEQNKTPSYKSCRYFLGRLFLSVESNKYFFQTSFYHTDKFKTANIYLITKEDLSFLVTLQPTA